MAKTHISEKKIDHTITVRSIQCKTKVLSYFIDKEIGGRKK